MADNILAGDKLSWLYGLIIVRAKWELFKGRDPSFALIDTSCASDLAVVPITQDDKKVKIVTPCQLLALLEE